MWNPRRSDAASGAETRRRFLRLAGASVTAVSAGCASGTDTPTPRPPEATVTVALRNRDSVERSYEVVVDQGSSLTDRFSGVLPAGGSVEMVATVRQTDEQFDFLVRSEGGQRGRTWEPTECSNLRVDAHIRNGTPRFSTDCRE